MLDEGVTILSRARDEVRQAAPRARGCSPQAIATLSDGHTPPDARLAAAMSDKVRDILHKAPLRESVTSSREYPLMIQREKALVSAWYEIFPRSEGAKLNTRTGEWKSGTFATAAKRLPAIADMGFDVVYLTPIHPIGSTHRKGRNNSLAAEPTDPGSPYAIGAAEGGHDGIHPDLGTMRSFKTFVSTARELGPRGGARLRSPVLARPPLGRRRTPSGSRPGSTARSRTRRTLPRSIRTSTR